MQILLTLIRKIKTFVTAVINDNVSVYAAQASFFTVISAVPFIMLLLTLVKYFLPVDQMMVLYRINEMVPPTIADFLATIINELYDKAASAQIISVTAVTTLWLASRGVMSLYQGINSVFKGKKKYNYFYARFLSVLYTLIFIVSLFLTMVVFGFGSKIESFMLERFGLIAKIISYIMSARIIIFMVLLTLCFAMFYKFFPNKNNKFKYQLPGALCAAAGWILFSYFYSIYIEYFSNYSYVYGSLTALVFLMLWLYFCMNILLYGAEINKLYEERFQKKY